MKTIFWKLYYKFKFGKDYSTKMRNAAILGRTIMESTEGNLSSFYDSNGNKIRGWHRRIKFNESIPIQHPLITKYNQ